MKYFKSAGDQSTEIFKFAKCRHIIKLLCMAAICMCLATSACDFREVEAQTATNISKESNMESIQTTTTIQNKIPPIDAAAATETETATFAMG